MNVQPWDDLRKPLLALILIIILALVVGSITGYFLQEEKQCETGQILTKNGCCNDTNFDGLCDESAIIVKPKCGDSICDLDETSSTCPYDCI
ncbi:MAG: hypothetical protein ABIH55_01015 [Nanoarchaeota archaeon]